VAGAVEMPRTQFQIANWSSAFLWAGVLLVFGDGINRVMTGAMKMLGWG